MCLILIWRVAHRTPMFSIMCRRAGRPCSAHPAAIGPGHAPGRLLRRGYFDAVSTTKVATPVVGSATRFPVSEVWAVMSSPDGLV
jgi:hypothetical protein